MDVKDLKVGDVVVEKLPHGLYSCIVVVDKYKKDVLYYIADYLSNKIPELNNPDLKKVYTNRKNIFLNNGKEIRWGDTFCDSSLSFERIGNIEVDKHTFASSMNESIDARAPYWDWLEEVDRKKYEKEITLYYKEDFELKNENINLSDKILIQEEEYEFLDSDYFWEIIQELFPKELDIDFAIDKLSEKSKDQIIRFNNTMVKMLEHLNDIKIIDKKSSIISSDDISLYIRCFIVANGKNYYNKIFSDKIFDASDEDDEFEDLLSLAEEALLQKGMNIDYDKMKEPQ